MAPQSINDHMGKRSPAALRDAFTTNDFFTPFSDDDDDDDDDCNIFLTTVNYNTLSVLSCIATTVILCMPAYYLDDI